MELKKELYIHNCVRLNEAEKELLKATHKLVTNIQEQNYRDKNWEDSYLTLYICQPILNSINELLNNYKNEYPEKDGE